MLALLEASCWLTRNNLSERFGKKAAVGDVAAELCAWLRSSRHRARPRAVLNASAGGARARPLIASSACHSSASASSEP